MPVVPSIEPSVQSRAITPGAALPTEANPYVATNTAPLTGAIDDAATMIKQRTDAVTLLNAQKGLDDWEKNTLFDPQNGYYAKLKGDAAGGSGAILNDYKSTMNKVAQSITDKNLQLKFSDMAQSRYETVQHGVLSHDREQTLGYHNDQIDATVTSASERAGLYYNNPTVRDASIAHGQAALQMGGAINGLPQEEIDNKKNSFTSTAYQDVLKRMVDTRDPQQALQAYDQYQQLKEKGLVLPKEQNYLDEMFKTASPNVVATKAFNAFQTTGQHLTSDDLFDHGILNTESATGQFNPDGSTVVNKNKNGTVDTGAAQINSGTAKEAAQLAGLPYDEKRLATDAGYNKALGKAYFNKQLDTYGNNQLAILAYHAGPGAVDDLIKTNGDPRKGDISMQDFLTKAGAEKSGYVGKVMAGTTNNASPIINMQQAKDYSATLPPFAQEDFLKQAELHNTQIHAAMDQNKKSLMDQVIAFKGQNGAQAQLPPTLQTAVAQTGMDVNKVKNYNPVGPSNNSTLTWLYGLDPKTLAETDLNTPDVRMNMSQTDYAQWKQTQTQLSNPAAMVTMEQRTKAMKVAFASRGLKMTSHFDPQSGQIEFDGGQDFIRANRFVDQQIAAYSSAHKGAYPGMGEIQQMVDNTFTNVNIPGKYFGSNDVAPYRLLSDPNDSGEGRQQAMYVAKMRQKNGQ